MGVNRWVGPKGSAPADCTAKLLTQYPGAGASHPAVISSNLGAASSKGTADRPIDGFKIDPYLSNTTQRCRLRESIKVPESGCGVELSLLIPEIRRSNPSVIEIFRFKLVVNPDGYLCSRKLIKKTLRKAFYW